MILKPVGKETQQSRATMLPAPPDCSQSTPEKNSQDTTSSDTSLHADPKNTSRYTHVRARALAFLAPLAPGQSHSRA